MKILSIIAFQVTPGVENLSTGKNNDLFIWIALAAGILALGLGIYLFTLISSLKKNDKSGISNVFSSERNIAVNAKADEDAEAKLEQRLGELEQRLYALENPGRIKEWSSEEIAAVKTAGAAHRSSSAGNQAAGISNQAAAGKSSGTGKGKSPGENLADKNALQGKSSDANQVAAKAPAEKLPEVKLPETQLLFAKLPDIENGFSAEVLSPVQDGEQVYEIKVKDDQGTYEISQATDAQKYALSDANYYLLGACDFQNQPSKDSKISTRRIGKLIKSGTQWIIQERASIEFI